MTDTPSIIISIAALGVSAVAVVVNVVMAWFTRRQVDALIASQRPWVGPRTVACRDPETGPPPLAPGDNIAASVYVAIFNSGREPAQDVRALFQGYILRSTDAGPAEFDTKSVPAKALFPQVMDYYYPFFTNRRNLPITQQEHDRIITGHDVAWVVGRIDYIDGAGQKRWSTVCTKFDWERKAFVPAEIGRWRNDAN